MPVPIQPPSSPPGRRARRAVRRSAVLLAGVTALAAFAGPAGAAQAPVGLGVASSFAVLSGSAVTNVGPSTIGGDLGVSPGTAVSGFPPGLFSGVLHAADAVATQAQADVTQAYGDAASRTPPLVLAGDLGGRILTPGVYRAPSSIGLTGTLTLDAQGDPSAVFIFQVGSTLTTASASRVQLINGAQPCNVTWQVGSSATLGSASTFAGNLLAAASISLDDAVTVSGRLIARSGAVTLINDTVTAAPCATGSGSGPDAGTPPATGAGTGPSAG
ncbi:MAG: ice-binding family protein, partial [Patulibacter sp.]